MILTKGQIYAFRMTSGEEVIARLGNIDAAEVEASTFKKEKSGKVCQADISEDIFTGFTIERPRVLATQIVEQVDGTAGMQMHFINWFNSNPDSRNVYVSSNQVSAICHPSQDIDRSYQEQTTPIKLA